jgi:hypothetical protein
MKEEILIIADKLRSEKMTIEEAQVLLLRILNGNKLFTVTFKYINRTDAAMHKELVEASNNVEACTNIYEKYNWQIEIYGVS